MRKPLIATATACLLAFGLPGCGDKSNDAQVSDQLDELIDKMSRLSGPEMPYPENELVYSFGKTIDGVYIAPAEGPEAAYIDQSVALLPLAQGIADKGNAQQKQVANGVIASILADEGSYLIRRSQDDFQLAVLNVFQIRRSIDLLREIVKLDNEIGRDRSETIAILKTGKINETTDVQGLTEMQASAKSAQQAAEQAREQIAQINSKIKALRDEVAQYESLELKLSNDALGAEGEVHYEKLDKATTAAFEAEIAQYKADLLEVDAEIHTGQEQLAQSEQAHSQASAEVLQDVIDQIEAEKRSVATQLAELDKKRLELIEKVTALYNQLDAQTKVLGFDRMAVAQTKLEKADEALAAANLGSGSALEQLSIYLLRARVLQQQSLAARSYESTLATLAASGPDVIGEKLHAAVTERMQQMKLLQTKVAADAAKLDTEIGDKVTSLGDSFGSDSPQAAAAQSYIDLYRTLLAQAK